MTKKNRSRPVHERRHRPADGSNLSYQLGRLVRELRASAGLSQRELAERIGTTQSVIARLETGGSKPSLTTLERVADAVGREVEVRFRQRVATFDVAQLAANLRLSPAERLSRATAFSRWVLRNRGRARAVADSDAGDN
jgi:transcriptional regulator with XRE-family HTH domain